MILNLDSTFRPVAGPEIAAECKIFSGGEPHIRIITEVPAGTAVTITHRLNSFEAMGMLCLAVDALQRMDAVISKLIIPYFPAARQDRVMVPGESLSVKVYADIINRMGIQKVVVFDPHSEVTPALLDRVVAVPNHAFVAKVLGHITAPVQLVAPDGGALKKIYKLSEYLGGINVVECSKRRDVKTGKLSGFEVFAEEDLKGKDFLVVDDICDGGGTFLGLAQQLRKHHVGRLFLAVSHGIFSHGVEELAQYYEKIFTTDSFRDISHEQVVQIALKDIL
jgi:ribose-phosphate pyrophosphokinase